MIEQALERLAAHLGREELRIRRSERFLAVAKSLNLRQRLILDHAVRHPSSEYSVKSHARANGVTKATARTDLEPLRRRQLLTAFKKTGKEVHYRLAPGVKERLARLTR